MAWYIEAWDVFDGMAFASFRTGGNGAPAEVVHIAAPDFHPNPVRDLAAALWGTRGTFQEGLFEGDREVSFRSLEEVVATVRRGYLGGGVGFDPGEGEPPGGEAGGGGAGTDGGGGNGDAKKLPPGDAEVLAYIEFLDSGLGRRGGKRPAMNQERLRAEISKATISSLEVAGKSNGRVTFDAYLQELHGSGRFSEEELIFKIPLGGPRAEHVRSWADHLFTAASDRVYLRSIRTWNVFAPLVAAAILVSDEWHHPFPPASDAVIQRALDWLAEELGSPGARPAEKVLAAIPALRGDYPKPPAQAGEIA